MAAARPGSGPWQSYIVSFHDRFAGITEEILAVAADESGTTPYGWLVQALPRDGLALDLACGSGPVQVVGWGPTWIGVDRSPAELAVAARRGLPRLVRADATALPFAAAAFRAAACSMAVMLFEPLDVALAQIGSALEPFGTAVFLLPGWRPVLVRDARRYARLLLALRRTRLFPHRLPSGELRARLESNGFAVVEDSGRRFAYPVRDQGAARRLVESLYAPGVGSRAVEAAVRVAENWVRSDIGIPLRRLVAQKRPVPDRGSSAG